MPACKEKYAKALRELGSGRSLIPVGVFLLVGAAAAILLPRMIDGLDGSSVATGYLLAALLAALYIIRWLFIIINPHPAQFPLTNNTDKKVKRFKVRAKCRPAHERDIVTQVDPPTLDQNQTAMATMDPQGCDVTEVTISVVVEGPGGDVTYTSDPIPAEVTLGAPCAVEIVEKEVEPDPRAQPPLRPTTQMFAHVVCNGIPPTEAWIPLNP